MEPNLISHRLLLESGWGVFGLIAFGLQNIVRKSQCFAWCAFTDQNFTRNSWKLISVATQLTGKDSSLSRIARKLCVALLTHQWCADMSFPHCRLCLVKNTHLNLTVACPLAFSLGHDHHLSFSRDFWSARKNCNCSSSPQTYGLVHSVKLYILGWIFPCSTPKID